MDIIQTLAQELDKAPQHVENVVRLLDEGNTIPFIARYRKELHGDPVNLETDVVGKYIEKLLRPEETKPHTPANESTLTKEMLLRCGF